MTRLTNVSMQAGESITFAPDSLRDLLLRVGELRGVLRMLPKSEQLLPLFALTEVYHALGESYDFDELLWYASAEPGKQKDAGFDDVARWRDAYVALWNGLRMRPVLNTAILQKFMASALGRNKKVRTSSESKVSIADRMKQVDVFLNLDSSHHVSVRSLLAADAIRRIKPFHDDGDPLVKLLPGLLVALEYELPLPLFGYTNASIDHTDTVDDHMRALSDGVGGTLDLIIELQGIRNESFERAKELLPSRMQSAELFDLIYSRPTVKVRDLVDAGIVKRQTAAEYLRALEDVRLLQSRTIGREVLYRNEQVTEIIGH